MSDAKLPVEKMIDNVVTPNEKPVNLKEGSLWATHSGVLDIAGNKLKCHILSNGMRIFDAEDVEKFFNNSNSNL